MAQHQLLTFNDRSAYEARLGGADERVVVSAPGAYRAELAQLDFGGLLVQQAWHSLPHVGTAGAHPALTSIVLLADQTQPELYLNGFAAGPGNLLLLGPGQEYHYHAPGDLRWSSTTMPTADLNAAAATLLGDELPSASITRLATPPPSLLAHLRALHGTALRRAAKSPGGLPPAVAKAMRHALTEAMVNCFVPDGDHAPRLLLDGKSVRVIRRFLDLVEANLNHAVLLQDVCSALGVPSRTLRQYCQGHLGMGPHHYLWLRRMNNVRRALREAGRGATVTSIANEHGSGELGRFAVRYRHLFGETPSAALGRSA